MKRREARSLNKGLAGFSRMTHGVNRVREMKPSHKIPNFLYKAPKFLIVKRSRSLRFWVICEKNWNQKGGDLEFVNLHVNWQRRERTKFFQKFFISSESCWISPILEWLHYHSSTLFSSDFSEKDTRIFFVSQIFPYKWSFLTLLYEVVFIFIAIFIVFILAYAS